jgi:hypothetical protein
MLRRKLCGIGRGDWKQGKIVVQSEQKQGRGYTPLIKIQESGENYLERFLMLKKEKGVVRSIDIAQHLSFTKPSIAGHVVAARKRLYHQG